MLGCGLHEAALNGSRGSGKAPHFVDDRITAVMDSKAEEMSYLSQARQVPDPTHRYLRPFDTSIGELMDAYNVSLGRYGSRDTGAIADHLGVMFLGPCVSQFQVSVLYEARARERENVCVHRRTTTKQ